MTDDLVKRLRDEGIAELDEAADRIEKLEGDVGVLIAASIRLSSRIDLDSDHYFDRIKKLEVALREILSLGSWGANPLARTIALEALEDKDENP
jgi:hypothetical protein